MIFTVSSDSDLYFYNLITLYNLSLKGFVVLNMNLVFFYFLLIRLRACRYQNSLGEVVESISSHIFNNYIFILTQIILILSQYKCNQKTFSIIMKYTMTSET